MFLLHRFFFLTSQFIWYFWRQITGSLLLLVNVFFEQLLWMMCQSKTYKIFSIFHIINSWLKICELRCNVFLKWNDFKFIISGKAVWYCFSCSSEMNISNISIASQWCRVKFIIIWSILDRNDWSNTWVWTPKLLHARRVLQTTLVRIPLIEKNILIMKQQLQLKKTEEEEEI